MTSTIRADLVTGQSTNSALKLKGAGTGLVKLGDGEVSFPDADGSANQTLQTNGSGVLSFATPAAGGAYTFISKITADDDADIEFTSGFSSTYDTFLMVASNIKIATDNTDMRFVWGPTSGYLAGTDYRGNTQEGANADSSGYAAYNWGGLAFNTIGRGLANAAGTVSGFHLYITGRESSFKTTAYGTSGYFNSSYRLQGGNFLYYGQTNWQLDKIKFYMSSGNITSGNICLYGISTS